MDGTEREIDKLGRVVIPIKIRRKLNLKPTSKVLIYLDGDKIVITATESHCAICGEKITHKRAIRLCDNCIAVIRDKELT